MLSEQAHDTDAVGHLENQTKIRVNHYQTEGFYPESKKYGITNIWRLVFCLQSPPYRITVIKSMSMIGGTCSTRVTEYKNVCFRRETFRGETALSTWEGMGGLVNF
jgi:hypothetical protein